MKLRLLALVTGALLLSACGKGSAPTEPAKPAEPATKPEVVVDGIKPVDIQPGFGYPGDRTTFQTWADNWEIDKITATAWDLWAGMTADSGQVWNGAPLPVWETWCGTGEAFSAQGCVTLERPARSFVLASQIAHTAQKAGKPAPGDTSVVSFNKFNPPMANYLAAMHNGPGPDGTTYSYTSQQSLANLNAAWPQGTSVADRSIAEAPYDANGSAMETKPVIFVVKANGLTPMPLWQGPAGAKDGAQLNAVPESWLTCVLLDPANSAGPDTAPVPATPEQIAHAVPNQALSCQTYLYAPLSTIYHFKLDQAEADNWNKNATNTGDAAECTDPPGNDPPVCLVKAEAGDYGVLAGMHVNTKTIVNWTWQTYWWQPGADTPDAFPGSKQGMTDKVKGAWRNYAMCTGWNQTQGNASKNMVVCFNPFLETSTGIPDGQSSNCMSCHGTATVGAPAVSGTPPTNAITTMNYPADYVAPIDFKSDACTQSPSGNTCFKDFTRTDFSWAIPGNARDDLPQQASPPAAAAAAAAPGN
jgi:hypothetical protein